MAKRWDVFDNEAQVLVDIRELLFLILHVQLSVPDPLGNTTKLVKRLERFVEERMVEDE
jgi:hypothetical protein